MSLTISPSGSTAYGDAHGAKHRPTLKSDAENVVKQSKGWKKINNQIEVLLHLRTTTASAATFTSPWPEPQLQKYFMQAAPPIRIIVKKGM